MSIKKYTNGSWTPACRKYGTETESITTLPATIIGDGTPISSYTIKGNMEQSGTPTPENPIMPSGCGVRTENVMPAGEQKTVVSNGVTFSSDGNGRYHISGTATAAASARFNLLSAFTTPISVSNGGQGTLSFFNPSADYDVRFVFCNGATNVDDWRLYQIRRTTTTYTAIGNKYVDSVIITVGSGVTVDMTITPEFTNDGIIPSEFEPYGYKLPLTLGSTTTDIYLGEVQTTRRVKKLVLTGEESWILNLSYYQYSFDLNSKPKSRNSLSISSHFYINERLNVSTYRFGGSQQNPEAILLINYDGAVGGVDAFKQFLAAQYAAGTPVTVWYVLAEPTTGIVNEPICKIGDYADIVSGTGLATSGTGQEFDVGTTLKPSEVDMTYHGWHEHEDTEFTT